MQSISVLAILAVAFSCTLALDVKLNQHWKLWKETNNKLYSDAEEHVRRAIWESNLKKVQQHNLQADLGVHTYYLGMNKYADMTITEFAKMMNGYNVTMRGERSQDRHSFIRNPNVNYQTPSTGVIKVMSHQLKIKANVVHVGLSQPPVHLKVNTSKQLANSFHFQNKT